MYMIRLSERIEGASMASIKSVSVIFSPSKRITSAVGDFARSPVRKFCAAVRLAEELEPWKMNSIRVNF